MAFSLKSTLSAVAVISMLAFGNLGNAKAQETDEIAKSLETVRLRYEEGLEVIRRDVLNEIEKMRRSSVREDDPVAARKRVEAIEEAFRNEGELPDVQKRNAWIERYNYWKDTLDRSYAKTVLDYQAAENDALAEVIAAEQEFFGKQLDLVPWGPNLIESPVEVAPDKPQVIEADIKGEYRIEIQAARIEGEGTLWVELPVSEKEKARVPLSVTSDGPVRAMITVSPEQVYVDSGSNRSTDKFILQAEGSARIAIESQGCGVQVYSICCKSIVYGSVDVEKKAKQPNNNPEPANPGDKLVAGLVLTGERITGDGKRRPEPSAKIESRTGDIITLITERLDGKGKFARTIRVGPNGSLTPIGLINRGGPLGNFTIQGGGGSFNGTVFQLHSKGTWSAPNTKNNAFNDELILQIK